MIFLREIKGVTTFDESLITAVREFFNIELLLLLVERFQLRLFGLSKMPQKRLPKQTLNMNGGV